MPMPALHRRAPLLAAASITTLLAVSAAARAQTVNLGYVAFDVTEPNLGEFDIANITGPNQAALGDPSFPVSDSVGLSNLALIVNFSDGSVGSYGQSYFTLDSDGLSFDGTGIAFGGNNPSIVSAVLTGEFSETVFNLAGGGTFTADSDLFTADITDPTLTLQDGDAALIYATAATTGNIPEPGSLMLLFSALGVLTVLRLRRRFQVGVAGALLALAATGQASATLVPPTAVGLTTLTIPSSGLAGISSVNLTASHLPSVAASAISVAIAPSCAAGASSPVSGEVDTVATSVTILPFGTGERIQFKIPASVQTGTYLVSIKGTANSGQPFASTGCSILNVTNSNPTLNSCLPTSSLAVLTGNVVTAYVPNAFWEGGATGVEVVPLEGSAAPPVEVPTPSGVNSCSSNPATGQTVCTGNGTDVYLLSGTTLTATLSSGANGLVNYSGGECANCGVAVSALTNTAYINEADSSNPTGSQLQVLNLSTNTFAAPIPTPHELSEDIAVDPTRDLILSASYGVNFNDQNYQLFGLNASGNVTASYVSIPAGIIGTLPDSTADDCSTGIALASNEEGNALFLTDLTQAVFGNGTWTAPSQSEFLTGTNYLSAGLTGMAVAPGSTHLGILSGEFGGNTFDAIQLPAAAGTGGQVPALVDYAQASLPNTPDGNPFSAGYDPHTTTAYTSPNNGKAYGVIADWYSGYPTYLAVIDLQALLAAPRTSGTNIVDPSVDLVGTGILRYVAAQ
jgi:hypothetical protein